MRSVFFCGFNGFHWSAISGGFPNLVALLVGVGLLLGWSTRASATIRVVQSTPVETDLAVRGIPQTQETWVRMIREARQSIDLSQMYAASVPGGALEPVLAELEAAAKRGVKIRLILSRHMLSTDRPTLERIQAISGLELGTYDLSFRTGGGINHAKYWIIDARRVFLGSQNFDYRAVNHIHETGLLIDDRNLAAQLATIFETDWDICRNGRFTPRMMPLPSLAGVELVSSPPDLNPHGIRAALDALIDLIDTAKRSIRIQVMDYMPATGSNPRTPNWPVIDQALRRAAARGVRVEMLVSHWNTEPHEIGFLKALSQVPGIDLRVSTIPEHSSGFIPFARVAHSKYMIVDDAILWLGTSNWSRSYFTGSRNIELIVRKAPVAKKIRQIFDRIWAAPFTEPVDVNRDYPPPRKS